MKKDVPNLRSDYFNIKESHSTSCVTKAPSGFTSSKSIKKLNDEMLGSYQLLDKFDKKTYARADSHARKVNTYLKKMKDDLVRAHVQSVKIENAKKEIKRYGVDVETIPERGGGDDPFGMLDGASM